MHKITWMFIVLQLIFNRFHLYLSINGIKFWYESKKFREEHMKPPYSMLTYINITKEYTNQIIFQASNIFSYLSWTVSSHVRWNLTAKHSTCTVLHEAIYEATGSAYSIIKKAMSELRYN
jgi:hypothetical protein